MSGFLHPLLPHIPPQGINQTLPLPLPLTPLSTSLRPSPSRLLHTTLLNLILLDLTVPNFTPTLSISAVHDHDSPGDQKEGLLAAKRIFTSIDSGTSIAPYCSVLSSLLWSFIPLL